MNEITVSICCITYNHEKYIEEALNSFLRQKTSFNYEIVVSNDCSTDNTQIIIDRFKNMYPEMIRDISPKENLGCIKNFYYALNSCEGKYIAYCEGDDYWIDEKKLQKQVDILQENPEYGLCYTKAKQFIQKTHLFSSKMEGNYVFNFYDLLNNGNHIPTLTCVFKKDLIQQYYREICPENQDWLLGDYPLWLYISYHSKIYFLDEVTSVYRILETSASHNKNDLQQIKFLLSVNSICNFFSNKYNVSLKKRYTDEQIALNYYFNKCNYKECQKIKIKNFTKKDYLIYYSSFVVPFFFINWIFLKIYKKFRH